MEPCHRSPNPPSRSHALQMEPKRIPPDRHDKPRAIQSSIGQKILLCCPIEEALGMLISYTVAAHHIVEASSRRRREIVLVCVSPLLPPVEAIKSEPFALIGRMNYTQQRIDRWQIR